MNNMLKKIIESNDIEIGQLIEQFMTEIFENGAINTNSIESLTYIKIFHPCIFEKYEESILLKMGLFFKPLKPNTLSDLVFQLYKDSINDVMNDNFTPVQVDIINKINQNQTFSFSSPTSTGKSFIFKYLIKKYPHDIVIIVPSRALINEYYKSICKMYKNDKSINILTFVDIINTAKATKNIFIITPERTKELFNLKDKLSIDLILFDEAQLGDEKSVRGLYYDSVIRRLTKLYNNAKFIFAYPFILNPEVQFTRNNIDYVEKDSKAYLQKNVGQIFYSFDDNGFYHFGIDEKFFGKQIKAKTDPLRETIENGGTALIYCSKTQIYNKEIFKKFKDYIFLCPKLDNPEALELIEKFRLLIGASNKEFGDYRSSMVNLLKRGIVIHHGSLPLSARYIMEEFTQKHFCKLCFATSTLDQGINMPFDLVWIDRFQPSKPLSVKNLIGRAGRSTIENKFDFGKIIIKNSSKGDLRKIVKNDILLDSSSQLDYLIDPNDDYKEYKEAIKNGEFSEEFNLTNKELERIQNKTSEFYIEKILDELFNPNDEITEITAKMDEEKFVKILDCFKHLYENYLNRELCIAEKYIVDTTIKIMLWKIKGKKFNQIVWYRYAYAARTIERNEILRRYNNSDEALQITRTLRANWLTQFNTIPNKKLNPLNLTHLQKAYQVEYDEVMVDTYDFIDKLLGFRFGDVLFAIFYKYGTNHSNNRAMKMANYIKYGTNENKEIWLLRYGFEFEDFDWLYDIVEEIDERGIKFKTLDNLEPLQYKKIERFI